MIKLTIEESHEYEDLKVVVQCARVDTRLEKLISKIRSYGHCVQGKGEDGGIRMIPIDEILYFESVDRKVFLYLKDAVYQSEMSIGEVEKRMKATSFCRVSKTIVLNLEHLYEVLPLKDRRYQAILSNDERVIVTRGYLADFKKRFGMAS